MRKLPKRQPKKVYSFRLSDMTKAQISNMTDDEMSEGEVIEWAINLVYQISRKKNPHLLTLINPDYSLND